MTMPIPGRWKIAEANGVAVPAFAFEVEDLAPVEARLAGHFVALAIAVDAADRPFLRVDVPDLEDAFGVAGPFPPDAAAKLDAAQQVLATNVVVVGDRDRELDLSDFGTDVFLDYTGELGRATKVANEGLHRDALERLAPLLRRPVVPTGAWYLAGRATAALGASLEALDLFDREVARCRGARGVIPAASFALNGKGVALKKLDRVAEAAPCFEAALRLRPNFFEALVTSATLFVHGDQAAVDRIPVLLARALKIRPTSPVFGQLLPALARELLTDPASFLRQLEGLAGKTDLTRPLFND